MFSTNNFRKSYHIYDHKIREKSKIIIVCNYKQTQSEATFKSNIIQIAPGDSIPKKWSPQNNQIQKYIY